LHSNLVNFALQCKISLSVHRNNTPKHKYKFKGKVCIVTRVLAYEPKGIPLLN
jgi:hypothetical protein